LIEINDGVRFSRRAGLIARQLCPVFMWCRKLDVGAHHPCWLLLQALFMTASVLTTASTTATRTIIKGVFMGVTSHPPEPAEFSSFKNEPAVNVNADYPGSGSSNAPLRKKSS
jgi:hypothetical protein